MYDDYDRYMIVLAIDTCDARGSVALVRDAVVTGTVAHESDAEYSTWLLPAVEVILAGAGLSLADVELFAVASGPGSFTGVRIGLTTVKAWSEVFGRPIVAVSRLEALASEAEGEAGYVASFVGAQAGQLFGAVYQRQGIAIERVGEEAVSTPQDFVVSVTEQTGDSRIEWVSSDPGLVENTRRWRERRVRGEEIWKVPSVLAPIIGKLGNEKALTGKTLDGLSVDANYVRRSYAEVSWKGVPNAAGK